MSEEEGTSAATTADISGRNGREPQLQRRIFIGPLPERVLSHAEQNLQKRNKHAAFFSPSVEDVGESEAESVRISELIKRHAYHFFLHQGGKAEDWGEEEEHSVTHEMLKRWKDSEWGAALNHRHRQRHRHQQPSHWVGGSFEVGRIMGVEVGNVRLLNTTNGTASSRRSMSTMHKDDLTQRGVIGRTSAAGDTFVTAHSNLGTVSAAHDDDFLVENAASDGEGTPAGSSTGLLRPSISRPGLASKKALTEIPGRPVIDPTLTTRSDGIVDAKGKSKEKQVHYADIPEIREPAPVPPSEVLERTSSTIEVNTSAAATVSPSSPTPSILQWGDVVLRDRMLVRVTYSKSETLSPTFDDAKNRTTRDLQYENWGEFLVAWRKDSIEIYEDHSLPMKEWIAGHKHLSYVIPLKSSRTRLSLYSWADLTFCITCPPTTTSLNPVTSRWVFSRAKEGTNIFIFKVKSRSRAYDWIWHLWKQMGGHIPTSIDIRNPTLNTKVTIDLPNIDTIDSGKSYKMFERENIIALCAQSLRSVAHWDGLIEREILNGASLQLAWRVGTNLDWIWLDDDVAGKPREWAVICGLALKQSAKPPSLEIRLAGHFPTFVHMKNGERLYQPPAIEGYLTRIRPNTQTRQPLYLATHNGYLFLLPPNDAYPPAPPSLAFKMGDIDTYTASLHQTEFRRGTLQLMHATGVCDLRAILAVRRAFQAAPPHTHDVKETRDDDDEWFRVWSQLEERTPADEGDEGGEDVANVAEDKAQLKTRRSFELLLNTGAVVRLEAHSCRAAIEWIERLRALILYWKQRHRTDAREEIEVAQARRPRLTPQTRACHERHDEPPDPPADLSAPYPALNTLYNWCVIDGCKPIIKGGKIYMRKGIRGQYKLGQLFLVNGYLVRFRITPQSSLHPVMKKKISLVDAYVCSGYFAAMTLPQGQYDPNAETAARRYQDGLEADDPEEDMLFMVWYRKQSATFEGDIEDIASTPATPKAVPSLSAKRKLIVFRTRSKLERDAWCWALNCEIEKLVRAQKNREQVLREDGNLKKLS
ncbi:Pleckstrin homology domain-containing protein [Crucibulum laeve]|uniref:Pleckstrin homology domain-containing protein n=1 Tax=Crucibulum laeve TaxID=68775 RepID=A0A5C3M7F2_9AGAR|nr:Pleckstrin homology domain-containing protein [Crucibulum laeve]